MFYDLLKAGHIVAVVIWFGGMMAVALLLGRGSEMAALRAWDQHITTSAMFVSWALGLAMATWAGWFASGWMAVKLLFVLALAAVHGVLSGLLRRAAANGSVSSKINERAVLSMMVVILAVIVLLVVIKPF